MPCGLPKDGNDTIDEVVAEVFDAEDEVALNCFISESLWFDFET